jgi:uncharacterized PurR-regulated membrane protein YhhQ (DUF165 family)
MNKIFLISSMLIWTFCLVILIIALTNLIPDNPLKPYSLIIGLGFLCITGFIRIGYKKLK